MGLTWRRFGQRPGTASHLEYVPECLRMLGGGGGGAVEDGHVVPLLLVRELRVALRSTYAKTIPPAAFHPHMVRAETAVGRVLHLQGHAACRGAWHRVGAPTSGPVSD